MEKEILEKNKQYLKKLYFWWLEYFDTWNLGTNLQMGFFPYVVYNFLKLLIGSSRNHF